MSEHPTDSPIISHKDASSIFDQAFKQGLDEMKHADPSKTEKVLGIFEVDSGTAGMINGAWNVAGAQLLELAKRDTHGLLERSGRSIGLQGKTLNRTIGTGMLAANIGFAGVKNIIEIAKTHKRHLDDDAGTARKIAPALDRLMGSHSILSYKRVKMDPSHGGNEVIWAHRQRSNKIADTENSNNYLPLGINVIPTVAPQFADIKRMYKGTFDAKAPAPVSPNPAIAGQPTVLGLVMTTGQGLAGPIATNIKKKNEYNLKKNMQACSALDMILTLQEQVEYDPQSRSFQLPKALGGKSLGLEEYIARVLIQHQKDMADYSAVHSELRDALKEDIALAVQPVADAIRSGEIDAHALIHLVGEQKIIKNNGRAVAGEDEVLGHVEKLSGVTHQPSMAPKEFYADRSFTKDEFIKASKQLDGEEKQRFLSLAPNEVLKDAGYSDKEISGIREATKARYDVYLTQALLGLAAESDEQLKQEGMPRSQVRLLRKLADSISEQGTQAVVTSKNGKAHALDAELLVLDFAVPKVLGDRSYLGKLASKGKDAAEAPHVPEEDEVVRPQPHGKHAEKYARRAERDREHFGDHDDDRADFRERVTAQRGSHHGVERH